MQITLSSFGTLGDLLPYLALGQALQARGHKILMAIPEGMLAYAKRARLDAFPCYPRHGPKQVKACPTSFDHWPADLTCMLAEDEEQIRIKIEGEHLKWQEAFDLKARIQNLVAACKNADVLVCHSLTTGEPVAAEIAAIPCVQAHVSPERLWQHRFQNFLGELESALPSMSRLAHLYLEWLQLHRLQSGLLERPLSGWHGYFRSFPALLGASRRFLAPLDTSGWKAEVCGFWFYDDPEDCAWKPDPELAEFVSRGPAPIILTFSSLPLLEPDRVLALHVEAARQISRPLVVLAGWSGMEEGRDALLADDVLLRGFLPQDWLFARAAAVIHHGGIGTTARALRNGCPMLVEPWGNDQFLNAMLVLKNGVGVAANPKKLTASELANLLAAKVLSEQTIDRAAALAEGIRHEDGLREAVRLIENGPKARL